MLIKIGCGGVSLEHLHPAMAKVFRIVTTVWDTVEPVITSTTDGTHGAGSLHPFARAVDFRLPPNATEKVIELKNLLGAEYDVVLEKTHIHVEYDPK